MAKRLIVPGLGGSEQGHWQQWWLAQDPDASLVEQDDWANPDVRSWVQRLAAMVRGHPGSLLVGHSLGATLIPHLGKAYPGLNIRGALIVAPADVDGSPALREIARGFAPVPTERLPFPAIVVASTNDPYLGIGRAMKLADSWGARFFNVGEGGHINTASGYGPWPGGLQLAQLLESPLHTPRLRRIAVRPHQKTRLRVLPLKRHAASRAIPLERN